MNRILIIFLLIPMCLWSACGDDDSGDVDAGGDTDSDTDTNTDTSSQGDYWEDGYCGDYANNVPASLDCNGVPYEGCCDGQDRSIWCEQEKLWCRDCAVEEMYCSWMESYYGLAYYDCDLTDWGPDPSGEHPESCDELAGGDAGTD